MKRTVVALALLICLLSTALVFADENTPGDDLIETTFYGIVVDSVTLEPIEGAYVFGFDDDFREYRGSVTNSKGEYYLEFHRGGHYNLYADHDLYEQGSADATVEMNDKTEMDFELIPKVFDTVIYGTVTDASTGDPLPEVMVNLYEYIEYDDGGYYQFISYQITGSDGNYSFETYEGVFRVYASKEGYDRIWKEITVGSGEKAHLDIALEQWARGIYGKVTDQDGNPMEGVAVALETDNRNSIEFTTTTDENGDYEIRVPREGQYTLKAFEDGYRPYSEDVRIPPDEMVERDIEMTKARLPDPLLRILYAILALLGII